MSLTFEELGLREEILTAVRELGYTAPTPVQEAAIPKLMKGYDLIGQSRTGTGKTAAFGIPLIELIDPDDRSLQGVVLCPTRELCMQVADELHKLLAFSAGIRVVPVYGGQPIDRQIQQLKGGAQIIVATPGRFMDHMRRHTVRLNLVQMVVLDEADEMLNMGFRDDMDLILSQMPNPRQTVLFSATMPEPIVELASQYMEDPVRIALTPEDRMTVEGVTQYYYEMKAKMKPEALSRVLSCEAPSRALVFCNTKKEADELSHQLKACDFKADCLHGNLNQQQRDAAMKAFRSGETKVLIATDIAARGLDISGVDLVVNFDLPEENEAYVHRVGRTARAGKCGKAVSFVVGKELSRLQDIMAFTGTDMEPRRLPTLQDMELAHQNQLKEELRERLSTGPSAKYRRMAEDFLAEGHDPSDTVAALFAKLLFVPNADSVFSGNDRELTRTPSRVSGKNYALKDTVRLFLNAGRHEGIRVKDIVGAFAGETGIPGSALGEISVLEHFSYVNVPAELVQDILTVMNGNEIKGRKIRVEIAEAEDK